MRYIAILVLTFGNSLAADWPNWRGPAHTGISAEPVPKADFSKIAWRAKIGVGFSSMAVAEGRVFALGCSGKRQGNQETLHCLDAATGKSIWSDTYPAALVDYLHEGGKPVVCIFGLAINGQQPSPAAADAIALINWLKDRAYVIGSGPYWWRTGKHDAGPSATEIYHAFDAVMPWSVGRYGSPSAFRQVDESRADAEDCASRGQGFAPIAFPGYSFHNTLPNQRPFNEVPRMKGGEFFKTQLGAFQAVDKATFYYVAMFDEVNEGTAIYKAAANKGALPAGGVDFVTMDQDGESLPSDFYLRTLGDFKRSVVARRAGYSKRASGY